MLCQPASKVRGNRSPISTCRRRVDLHHDAVDLRLREVELLQEPQLGLLRALQLADGLRHRLVVLPLVVDRVRQDEAEVQRPPHGGVATWRRQSPPARLEKNSMHSKVGGISTRASAFGISNGLGSDSESSLADSVIAAANEDKSRHASHLSPPLGNSLMIRIWYSFYHELLLPLVHIWDTVLMCK